MDKYGQLDFSDLEVVKSKNLMRSHYSYEALDQKIMSIAFAKFDKSKKKCIKEGIKISCNDVMDLLEVNGNNIYAQMHESASHLMGCFIDIYDDEKQAFIMINLFGKVTYKNGIINIRISDDAIKCLETGVKLRYLLGNFKQLQSKYSIREYEILRSYLEDDAFPYYEKKRKYVEIGLDEFRLMTGTTYTNSQGKKVEKYKNSGDFKIKVLNVADREINKYTDLNCKYIAIKKGRAMKAVGFWISSKSEDLPEDFQREIYERNDLQPPNNDIIEIKNPKTDYDFNTVESLMKEMPGLKLVQLKSLLDQTDEATLRFVYGYLTKDGDISGIYQRILDEL